MMIPVFVKIGNTLKDLWKNELKNGQNNNEKNMVKVDVIKYMSDAVLEIIGIIGKYA